MTLFWVLAAVLTLVALAFVLLPLLRKQHALKAGHAAMNVELYRDQFAELEQELKRGALNEAQFEESKRELERSLLQDVPAGGDAPAAVATRNWPLAAAMGLMLPLLAVALYLSLGTPQAIVPQPEGAPNAMGHAGDGSQVNMLIDKLAKRLKENTPDDGEGWALLARSYTGQGRFAEAVVAFDRAVKLLPPSAQLLADYADVQAMANGRQFNAKTDLLIKQALEADPNHPKALMLAGSVAFVRSDFAKAADYWEKLLKLLPPGSAEAGQVQSALNDALAQLPPGSRRGEQLDNLADFAGKDNAQPVAANAAASVSGVVTLGQQLAGKAAPTDKLRVFARAANGPKMPLAIVDAQVKDLPFKFTLTDAMAMMPAMKLSNFPEVEIVARITKSGGAQAQPGDIEGSSGTVKVGAKDVTVVLERVVQ